MKARVPDCNGSGRVCAPHHTRAVWPTDTIHHHHHFYRRLSQSAQHIIFIPVLRCVGCYEFNARHLSHVDRLSIINTRVIQTQLRRHPRKPGAHHRSVQPVVAAASAREGEGYRVCAVSKQTEAENSDQHTHPNTFHISAARQTHIHLTTKAHARHTQTDTHDTRTYTRKQYTCKH